MSTHIIPTRSQTADCLSGRAARRVTAHRRAAVASAPASSPAGAVSLVTAAQPATQSPATSGARILRRWSVAELIYRAAAQPPVVA